jgi:hypothetical protein
LTGFSGSSIGFGFFILILFGCFFFSYFSSKRGCLEAKANISFLLAKMDLDLPRSRIYASICSVKERTTKD